MSGFNSTRERLQSLANLWHTDLSWRQQCQDLKPRLKSFSDWLHYGIYISPGYNSPSPSGIGSTAWRTDDR